MNIIALLTQSVIKTLCESHCKYFCCNTTADLSFRRSQSTTTKKKKQKDSEKIPVLLQMICQYTGIVIVFHTRLSNSDLTSKHILNELHVVFRVTPSVSKYQTNTDLWNLGSTEFDFKMHLRTNASGTNASRLESFQLNYSQAERILAGLHPSHVVHHSKRGTR